MRIEKLVIAMACMSVLAFILSLSCCIDLANENKRMQNDISTCMTKVDNLKEELEQYENRTENNYSVLSSQVNYFITGKWK